MRIVTVAEMKRLEEQANAAGLPYQAMMETAGLRVAEVAERLLRERHKSGEVVVLVGPGNNGGDGLVAARHLAAAGHSVYLHLVRGRSAADEQWRSVTKLGVPYSVGDDPEALARLGTRLAACSMVVDALLGAGASPPVRDAVATLLGILDHSLAERSGTRRELVWPSHPEGGSCAPIILAVDVPSGLDADTGEIDGLTPRAAVTVAIGFPKLGHFRFPGAERVGELVVADTGLDDPPVGQADLELLTAVRVGQELPVRPRDGHKGTFGSVLVVAGSGNYVGAGLLAAAGAARAGCGLVTLASVSPVVAVADTLVPEATRLHLPGEMGVIGPEAVPVLRREMGRYQALLLGPGLTQEKAAAAFLERLLGGSGSGTRSAIGFLPAGANRVGPPNDSTGLPPLVVDADGLNLLAAQPHLLERLPADSVVTPHPGEMARLLGRSTADVQADRLETARAAAKTWRLTVVLKGAFTVVAAPDGRTSLAPFANPALASAGTGDVLAGVIASLLAQGLAPYAAARAGVYLHGVAGELAAADMRSAGVLASDLLRYLSRGRAAISY